MVAAAAADLAIVRGIVGDSAVKVAVLNGIVAEDGKAEAVVAHLAEEHAVQHRHCHHRADITTGSHRDAYVSPRASAIADFCIEWLISSLTMPNAAILFDVCTQRNELHGGDSNSRKSREEKSRDGRRPGSADDRWTEVTRHGNTSSANSRSDPKGSRESKRIPPSASVLQSILQRTTRSREYMDHRERARAQLKLQEMDNAA